MTASKCHLYPKITGTYIFCPMLQTLHEMGAVLERGCYPPTGLIYRYLTDTLIQVAGVDPELFLGGSPTPSQGVPTQDNNKIF